MSTTQRRITGLFAILAIFMAAPLAVASGLSLSIVKIGPKMVGQETANEAPEKSRAESFLHSSEPLVFRLSSPLPPRTRLYVLSRREGENAWTVQPVTEGPGRSAAGEWTTQVKIGRPGDLGKRFEVQVVAAREALPALLSDGMRARTLLTSSPVVAVERRGVKPSVTITQILAAAPASMDDRPPDPQYVTGDAELMVHDVSLVGLAARDLPAGSRVGVAVQPASTNDRWVMDDLLLTSPGSIKTHFGTGDGSEDSFHYEVSAFVAPGDAVPPTGRAIPPAEWQRYQSQLLAESPTVRVARWQRELRIEEIGGAPVQPRRILIVDPQVEVRGAAKRKLEPGERIWLVCVPLQGDPWVARSTSSLTFTPSGHWSMKTVQLRKIPRPEPFDVVAVVSAEDVSKIPPEKLRSWLDGVESSDTSTRVSVAVTGAGIP